MGNYIQAKIHIQQFLHGITDSLLTKNEYLDAWNILALSEQMEGHLKLAKQYFKIAYDESVRLEAEV